MPLLQHIASMLLLIGLLCPAAQAAVRQTAQHCARDAANYVHPKLANVQHGSDSDTPLNAVTGDDRAQVIVAVLAENPKMLDRVLKQLT